jgi:hypothetical protein
MTKEDYIKYLLKEEVNLENEIDSFLTLYVMDKDKLSNIEIKWISKLLKSLQVFKN